VWVTPRVYVGGEARFGWELHTRVAGTVGVQLRRSRRPGPGAGEVRRAWR
jgi:hypothetical protein